MPKIYHNPPYERIDCGSGHHYGICPKCGRGHGQVLVSTIPDKHKPATPCSISSTSTGSAVIHSRTK